MPAASDVLLPSPRRSHGAPPPPHDRDDTGGGDGSGWVRLLSAHDDIEGHLLMGRLGEAGVEARIAWERGAPSAWLYGARPWPVAVMVRRRQLEDARMVLAEVSWGAPEHVRPPEPPRDWRVPVVWWSIALTLGVLFTGIGLAQLAQVMHLRCRLPILCTTD